MGTGSTKRFFLFFSRNFLKVNSNQYGERKKQNPASGRKADLKQADRAANRQSHIHARACTHTHALSRVANTGLKFVFAFGFTFAQNQGPGFMLFGTVITRAYFIGLLIKLNGYSTMAATYLQSMAKNEEPTSNLNETQANNVTNVTN